MRQGHGHASHLLPSQSPLDVFVHHNTLHAFQSLPFHDALAAAQSKLGMSGYMPEASYRDAFRRGRIRARDLDAALSRAELSLPPLPAEWPDTLAFARAILVHGIERETAAGL